MENHKKFEILAPAGDLSTAIRAYEAGAHAVYLGLKDFSARKGATNFDFSELRRLKAYATEHDKAFYVTLNTIIKEDELEAMHATLSELDLIGPTALIVQDLGLVRFVKKYFPNLTLHASTQMAIHNSSGLKMAKELGIERVVLSRELTYEQIKRLRVENQDIELEVFIHGALCYSFSGMCLASGLLLERSGNRGLCAQLCRNFYRTEGKESYPFSCNDLALHEEVIKLAQIGINSFKIEGRLKSKEYVQSTVKLYGSLLNPESKDQEKLKKEAALNFARKQSSAYFHAESGKELIDPLFPGHRGVKLGVIENVKGEVFSFRPEETIDKNDTLLILNTEGKFTRFTIFNIKKENQKVHITFEDKEDSGFTPCVGDEVYLIHSFKQVRLDELDYKQIAEEKHSLTLKVYLSNKRIKLETTLGSKARLILDEELDLQEAKSDKDFRQILLNLFKEAQDSRFIINEIDLNNLLSFEKIFAPLSQLKRIKNHFYEKLAELYLRERAQQWEKIKSEDKRIAPPINFDLAKFARRLSFIPQEHIPFAHLCDLNDLTKIRLIEGLRIIPLLPVLPEEKEYWEALEKLIDNHPHEKFLLGLNNLGHLAWAKTNKRKNLAFFSDFYLYHANRFSVELLSSILPNLQFTYEWVESPIKLEKSPVTMLTALDRNELPYFISLGCFEKHNVFKGKCPPNCVKRYTHALKNGQQNYQVIVKDCITYMRKISLKD